MITITFKDSYGEKMQPIEAESAVEATRSAERLERLGYMDIEVAGVLKAEGGQINMTDKAISFIGNGADLDPKTRDLFEKRHSIAELNFSGGSAYLQALEDTRAEMCKERGVRYYTDREAFDYAKENGFQFDFNGYLF